MSSAPIARFFRVLGPLIVVALTTPATAGAKSKAPVVSFSFAKIGSHGNPSASIVPFEDGIYPSCALAPAGKPA